MTDPLEPTPEQIAAGELLSFTKQSAGEALIRFLNGMTTNHLSAYPQAEVQSWPYQKAEADAVIAAGAGATLAMAPFLVEVCGAHFGAADDATRLDQLTAKAAIVQANAIAWSAMSAFVNGLRARTQDAIEAATEPTVVNDALNAAYQAAQDFVDAASAA